MDLPSFIWLWRIAAWSMGLSLTVYGGLVITGSVVRYLRSSQQPQPGWLRLMHIALGCILVALVLLLLAVGVVGTLGEHGRLGHSWHLGAGVLVVALVLGSAVSASQIASKETARALHVAINAALFIAFSAVSYSGWQVVQQYLP